MLIKVHMSHHPSCFSRVVRKRHFLVHSEMWIVSYIFVAYLTSQPVIGLSGYSLWWFFIPERGSILADRCLSKKSWAESCPPQHHQELLEARKPEWRGTWTDCCLSHHRGQPIYDHHIDTCVLLHWPGVNHYHQDYNVRDISDSVMFWGVSLHNCPGKMARAAISVSIAVVFLGLAIFTVKLPSVKGEMEEEQQEERSCQGAFDLYFVLDK